MAKLAIDVQNLGRTFQVGGKIRRGQEVVAVRDVSFAVEPGQIFGLLGPNGAGKTTTVRMLSTLLLPTAGRALVAEYDVATQPREVRKRIGMALGGDRGVFFRLTAEQNLQYFAAINHIPPRDAARRVDELLKLVGLSDRRKSKVLEYSRGMKQRLHLARALLTDPEILFLDEPTSGLDPVGAFEFRQLVAELAQRGRTVLLTTHYMLEADELCDELCVINRGSVVAAGRPSDIKRRFGTATVVELRLKRPLDGLVERVALLPCTTHTELSGEGLVQVLRVQVVPGADARDSLFEVIGADNVASFTSRDSTLEEAYLSLIRGSPAPARAEEGSPA